MKFRTEINVRGLLLTSYADALFYRVLLLFLHWGPSVPSQVFRDDKSLMGCFCQSASICGLLWQISDQEHFQPSDTFCQDGVWNSFSLHGCFSATSQEALLDSANRAVDEAHDFLEKTSCLFITLGTAAVLDCVSLVPLYRCHKGAFNSI